MALQRIMEIFTKEYRDEAIQQELAKSMLPRIKLDDGTLEPLPEHNPIRLDNYSEPIEDMLKRIMNLNISMVIDYKGER